MRTRIWHWKRGDILLCGLKRSGNHAVINWMREGGRFVHFNNVVPFVELVKTDNLDADGLMIGPRLVRAGKAGWDMPFLRRRRALVSVEETPCGRNAFGDVPSIVTDVVVLRDPRNLFASRIRKGRALDHPAYPRAMSDILQRTVDLWKSHARWVIAHRDIGDDRQVGILFDLWVSSRAYRAAIAEKLEIRSMESTLDRIAREGGGSSFGANEVSVREGVLNRVSWLDCEERALWEALMADEEMGELRAQVFGGWTSDD